MKKTILLSFALFLGTNLFSQTNTGTATKKSKSTAGSGANSSTNSAPACYAGKTWKLSKVEKFSIAADPGADQKDDMLLLNIDGTFKMILKGVTKVGDYTRGGWLNLKPRDGSEALPVKVESCDGTTLKVDWRDGDTHNHFTYTAQ